MEKKQKLGNLEMHWEANRLATFESWPFESQHCKCGPEKMAEAGFYSISSDSEPDAVRCFLCAKELDNWEENDDPWKEHKRHNPKCAFVMKGKKEAQYTIEEWLKLECKRQQLRLNHFGNESIEIFKSSAESTRNELEKVFSN